MEAFRGTGHGGRPTNIASGYRLAADAVIIEHAAVLIDAIAVAAGITMIGLRSDHRANKTADAEADCRPSPRAYAGNDRAGDGARSGANCGAGRG